MFAQFDDVPVRERLQNLMDLARRHLGMDVALLSEFVDGDQVFCSLAGDPASFAWKVHDRRQLSTTYCGLMVEGLIPHAIADTSANPLVRELALTREAGIGSYVGVPVRLSDGSLFGSLCTLSHGTRQVDDKDVKFLRMLAELVAIEAQSERNRAAERARICELISGDQVAIALQPIVDVGTGWALGFEALSRFPIGYASPDQVFAAAHVAGVGVELEGHATISAFRLLPLLRPPLYLALNLTPAAVKDLVALAAFTGSHLPLNRLVLEITEHQAVENYAQLRDSLASVRQLGLRLAIDDAGAGYASLHHIVELQPDIIKIDRSLIDGLAQDPARRSVVKAFSALASDFGAKLVGEGVESLADLESARALGVHSAQGFLLGRPSTDRDVLEHWQSARFCVGSPPRVASAG